MIITPLYKPTLYVGNMFDLTDLFPQLKQMELNYDYFAIILRIS